MQTKTGNRNYMVQIENQKNFAQPELENMIASVVGKTAQLLFYLQIFPVHHWRNLIKTYYDHHLFLVPVDSHTFTLILMSLQ